jgi:hypothetical protein
MSCVLTNTPTYQICMWTCSLTYRVHRAQSHYFKRLDQAASGNKIKPNVQFTRSRHISDLGKPLRNGLSSLWPRRPLCPIASAGSQTDGQVATVESKRRIQPRILQYSPFVQPSRPSGSPIPAPALPILAHPPRAFSRNTPSPPPDTKRQRAAQPGTTPPQSAQRPLCLAFGLLRCP